MKTDSETRLLQGFMADYPNCPLIRKPGSSGERRVASLNPRDFVGLLIDRDCPECDGQDVRITSKISVRNFSRGLQSVAAELRWGYTYLSRALTWQVCEDRKRSKKMARMRKLYQTADRIRLHCNDHCIDSLLSLKGSSVFGEIDTDYTTIRVLNKEVKEELLGQAIACNIPLGMYVQVCIVEHLLKHYGGSAWRVFGNTTQAWQETVDGFNKWFNFGIEYLDCAISQIYRQKGPDCTAAMLALLAEQTADGSKVTRESLISTALSRNDLQLVRFIYQVTNGQLLDLGYIVDESGTIVSADME